QQTAPLASPPQRDVEAVALLTTAYEKLGGATKSQLADVTLSGSFASPDSPNTSAGSFVAKARGTDFSMDVSWRSGNRSRFCVLTGKGSVRTDGKTQHLPPHMTYGLRLDLFPLFGRWTDFVSPDVTVRSEQEIALNGSLYRLVRVENSQPPEHPWLSNDYGKNDVVIDPNSGLVVSIRYTAPASKFFSIRVQVENRYEDYRLLSGLFVPTKITRYTNGQAEIVLHVDSVVANSRLLDADFQN